MNTSIKVLILIITPLFLILTSCKTETKGSQVDLLKYGMPIKITAPDDAIITSDDLGFMKDITVKSGDDYSIQILSSNAIERKIPIIIEKLKDDVKSESYFDSITEDQKGGFIYKKNIDGTEDYDFRYVKIVGDNEYLFQTGLVGTFSLEQVKLMLESVK